MAGIVRFVGCIAIGAGILLKRPTIEFIGSCTFILSALISTVTVIIVFGRDFRFIYVVPELLAVLSFAAYSVTLRFRRIQFLCGVSVAAMIMSAAIKIAMIDIYLTSTFILALSLFFCNICNKRHTVVRRKGTDKREKGYNSFRKIFYGTHCGAKEPSGCRADHRRRVCQEETRYTGYNNRPLNANRPRGRCIPVACFSFELRLFV